MGGVLFGLLFAFQVLAVESPRQFFLEVDIAIERGGLTGVLFDFGDGIWGENSAVANVPPGTAPHSVRLELPRRPIRALRFDPTADDQVTQIDALRLVTDRGEVLLNIDPKTLRPMQQIQSIVASGSGVRVYPVANANDPMLRLEVAPLQKRMHEVLQRPTVGPGAVVFLAVVLGAVALLTVFLAGHALGGRRILSGGAAIFCLVWGARLWWLNLFSRPVPFWDEWEGDALYVLIPFVGGFLDWGALFMPQWEHRILLTRVITLFGTLLNGEWDPRVAMTVSAAMFSATIALIATALLAARSRAGVVAALLLAGGAALPYDFNNLLWGGQTQMYGLILLAICTLGLASSPAPRPLVYVGVVAGGLLSLFTMGAGPVAPGLAAGICGLRAWFEQGQRRPLARMAAMWAAIALLGVFLHVSSRAHVPLYAANVAQFWRTFLSVLAWPFPPAIPWAMLVWLPWIINGGLILRRRAASPLEWLAVGLGGWGLVNAIALGYARPYEGPPFDSRFFTAISIGAWGSVCSSVALAGRASRRAGSAVAWLAACAVAAGLIAIGMKGFVGARESGALRAELDHRIRVFLSTGNPTPLVEKPPHHTGIDVVARLESPLLQQVLPAPYRRSLASREANAPPRPIEAGIVTLTVRSLMKTGPAIAAVGLIGFVFFVWRFRLLPQAAKPWPAAATAGWRNVSREDFLNRTWYAIAAAATIGWTLVYNFIRRDGLVDEPGHLVALHHFLDGRAGWPEAMPMLPGYHFIVLGLWQLYPALTIVTTARLTTAFITLLGFAAFALAWRRLHEKPAGRMTLLLALLPLTQPFTGMVYTDMPALSFVLCAVWAQVSGRRSLAVGALVGAVMIRQTNLAWAGFLVGWEFLRRDEPRSTVWRRIAGLIGLMGLAAAIVLSVGRLTLGTQHGNQFELNIASIHFGALLVLLLGLPIWIVHAPSQLRRWRETARLRPRPTLAILALGLAAAAMLAIQYRNPHIWNRELFWEGCSFTLLRNWPLVWIDAHAGLKALSSLNVVLMVAAFVEVFARQRHRRELWLAVGFGALPVLTNGLVEPRYFIPAAGLVLLFLEIAAAEWRWLVVWWAALSLLHAPFVARALSLW